MDSYGQLLVSATNGSHANDVTMDTTDVQVERVDSTSNGSTVG